MKLLGILPLLLAMVPAAQASWIPLAPTAEVQRVRISGETGDWTRLADGDTLEFVVRDAEQVRLRTRARVGDSAPRVFRIRVEMPDGTVRRLRRTAEREGTLAVLSSSSSRSVELTERDDWTDSTAAHGRVRVYLAGGEPEVFVRLLISRSAAARAEMERSKRVPWRANVELEAAAIGLDSNAYLAPTDLGGEESAWFWPLHLGVGFDAPSNETVDWGFDYAFDGRFHEASILDEKRHRLRAEQDFAWDPVWTLRLEERLRTKDDTYFGRGEFEERETGSDVIPGATVSLRDRFDWTEARMRAEVERDANSTWRLASQVWWIRRNYSEDYDAEPNIYSLDQNRLGFGVEAERRLDDEWSLQARGALRYWKYDEKFARDVNGAEQSDVQTRLRRWPLEVSIERRQRRGLSASLGLGVLVTQDLEAGYWDRKTWSTTITSDWRGDRGLKIGLRVRRSNTDYDRARLDNLPTSELRKKDSWRVGFDARRDLGRDWRLRAELDFEALDNNSRDFAYERSEFVMTLSYRR